MALRRSTAKTATQRVIRCYLCGHAQEVSTRAMSTNCPKCHKAIRIEDFHVKTYVPVNDLQTCGKIVVAKKGRVAAKRIHAGDGIECEGILHGAIDSLTEVVFAPKAEWKGPMLRTPKLIIQDGAVLEGHIRVPWVIDENDAASFHMEHAAPAVTKPESIPTALPRRPATRSAVAGKEPTRPQNPEAGMVKRKTPTTRKTEAPKEPDPPASDDVSQTAAPTPRRTPPGRRGRG